MAIITAASGTQAATVGTEHTLATITTPGRYWLAVDVSALVAGATPDIVELRLYTRVLSGGTNRIAWYRAYTGGLVVEGLVQSMPVVVDPGTQVVATLKQTQGTGRSYPWKVMREFSQPTGSVVSDAGNSAASFKTDLAETATDYWNDALVVFVSGNLAGQVKKVTAYNGSSKVLTVSGGFTGTPSAGDAFVLVVI
jgi:hypothetical protein